MLANFGFIGGLVGFAFPVGIHAVTLHDTNFSILTIGSTLQSAVLNVAVK